MTATSTRISVGKLPNFLIIGAMKAGTTSLYHYVRDHPQIFLPAVKDLSFFAREPERGRGLARYARQFSGAGPDAIAVGEVSTIYAKYPRYPGVPERIAAHLPEVRLIYVVRDPIERIRSHYRHRTAVGTEKAPFERAVFDNPIYVDYSKYAMQIEQYLAHFCREQLLIITSEDLRNERQTTTRRVYQFLGVDADYVSPNLHMEFYRTDERVAYPPLVWRVRRGMKKRFPASKRIRLADMPLATWLGRRLQSNETASAAPMISEEVRERLIQLLEEDVRRLRGYVIDGSDGWGFA